MRKALFLKLILFFSLLNVACAPRVYTDPVLHKAMKGRVNKYDSSYRRSERRFFLRGQGISDLSGFEKVTFHRLEHLELGQNVISDLKPLKGLSLKKLNIESNNLTNCENLPLFLESLNLLDNPLESIEGVGQLVLLEELSISVPDPEELSELYRLNQLKKLVIENSFISDFAFLKEMRELQELSFLNCDIRPLGTYPATQELPVMADLTQLEIRDTGISDFRFLQKLPALKVLDLSGSAVSCMTDFNAPSLYRLSFNGAVVTDFDFLGSMPVLESICLYVKNPERHDYSFLQACPELMEVDSDSTKVWKEVIELCRKQHSRLERLKEESRRLRRGIYLLREDEENWHVLENRFGEMNFRTYGKNAGDINPENFIDYPVSRKEHRYIRSEEPCQVDIWGTGFNKRCEEAGYRIPQDVRFLGVRFNDGK